MTASSWANAGGRIVRSRVFAARWQKTVWVVGVIVGATLWLLVAYSWQREPGAEELYGAPTRIAVAWTFALAAPTALLPGLILARWKPEVAGVVLIAAGMMSLAVPIVEMSRDWLAGRAAGDSAQIAAYLALGPLPALVFGVFCWSVGYWRVKDPSVGS